MRYSEKRSSARGVKAKKKLSWDKSVASNSISYVIKYRLLSISTMEKRRSLLTDISGKKKYLAKY
jgi:hypothetical protein